MLLYTFLGYNIFERHDIIVNSIGAFLEEIQAYEKIQMMIGLGYSIIVFLTIIQVVSYYLYNAKCHPLQLMQHSNLGNSVAFDHRMSKVEKYP